MPRAVGRTATPGINPHEPVGPDTAAGRTLPRWLDGQTIAMIGTVLRVGIGIGAMVLASTSAMRAEMNRLHARIDDVRTELIARIDDVRKELGAQYPTARECNLTADINRGHATRGLPSY